jgi:hypothetical protein
MNGVMLVEFYSLDPGVQVGAKVLRGVPNGERK